MDQELPDNEHLLTRIQQLEYGMSSPISCTWFLNVGKIASIYYFEHLLYFCILVVLEEIVLRNTFIFKKFRTL